MLWASEHYGWNSPQPTVESIHEVQGPVLETVPWFLTVKADPEAQALRTNLQSQSRRPCIPALPGDEGTGVTSL